jgi:hypothetical protein
VSANLIVARAARATARELAPQYGIRLEAQVEAALFDTEAVASCQFIDPTALGSLIVSIAALAYQIYSDHQKRESKPTSEFIVHTIKKKRSVELTEMETKIIETVSAEVVKYGDNEDT